MNDKILKIGLSGYLDMFESCFERLEKKQGSIIAIAGEEGYGKSHLCDVFIEHLSKQNSDVGIYSERNIAPIGEFNVGNIQPLHPFVKIMENIITGVTSKSTGAKQTYLKNLGLTLLASLPIIDTVFYAVKEISKDHRQYKLDKVSEKGSGTSSNSSKDFLDSFAALSEKTGPMMIVIEDFHWSDAQSIELLNMMVEEIKNIPLLVVVSYRQSILTTYASPMLSFVDNYVNKENNVFGINLKEFTKEEISAIVPHFIENYKTNYTFESWLFENSYGVPGVVTEYLRYFTENSPFNEEGNLISNFTNSEFLPASVHSAFSKTVDKLSEEEKNILSICSSEGREFTVLIVSNLMNTDVLSSIKKLKHIQQKYGIIKSLGAHTRYGVKTTIYEFSQAFYKKYFENLLEYEEKTALHGQIAALLKEKYDSTSSDAVKQEIAPYLAAHSIESGDDETAKSMLLVSAQAAEKHGNVELLQNVYDQFQNLGFSDSTLPKDDPDLMAFKQILQNSVSGNENDNVDENNDKENSNNGAYSGAKDIDFSGSRKIVIQYYHEGRLQEAIDFAINYTSKYEEDLRSTERAQFIALIMKCYIDMDELSIADKYANEALELIEQYNDPIAECFVYNTISVLKHKRDDNESAMEYLKKAAQKSINLSPELKLLTISNIALILEKDEPDKSRIYFDSVRKLATSLNFEEFADQVLN